MSAEDAPLCALVPTIVALQRIEAGKFVMLEYWVHYSMDNRTMRAATSTSNTHTKLTGTIRNAQPIRFKAS